MRGQRADVRDARRDHHLPARGIERDVLETVLAPRDRGDDVDALHARERHLQAAQEHVVVGVDGAIDAAVARPR